MTNFLHRHKSDIFVWLTLLFVFLISRLINLTLIPIFTDEAIYLRWSQIMAYDAGLRYLPLVDGKPPLFMWITAIGLRVMPFIDPLFVIRLVSVGSGLLAMIGIFFTTWQLFRDKKIAYLASVAYLLSPFTFFYDRFGLADSMLAMFGIWSLGLGVKLVRTLRLDVAMILGIVAGLGLLTKMPAFFFLAFLPVLLLLFDWKSGSKVFRLTRFILLSILVVFFSQAIFSILRLFPLFHMISQKNTEFVVPLFEGLLNPFHYFRSNILTLIKWEVGYLTVPFVLVILLGVVKGLFSKDRLIVFILLFYFMGHFLYMSIFNKSIFPRFLLTFTPMLLILGAYGISQFKKKILFVLVFAIPLFVNFRLITNPKFAPIPDGDLNQYISGWPAGYGVRELRNFFSMESQKYPVVTVGTEGTFGLMPYALQIYQNEYPNVNILDYWPMSVHVPKQIGDSAKDHPTYFIIYQQQTVPPLWKMDLVASYQQGTSKDSLRLYRVLKDN